MTALFTAPSVDEIIAKLGAQSTCDAGLTQDPWHFDTTTPSYGPGASMLDRLPANAPRQQVLPDEYRKASDEELQQITDVVVPKLIAAAQQAGVTGTAPYSGDPDSDAANSASAGSVQDQVPPEHQEAYMLAQQGDYAGAAAAYEKVLEADPNDTRAARERAKALLLARSANADVRVVRAAAADKPDDVDAQLAVADIDMIGGQIQDAFDRLLDFVAAGHKTDIEPVRQRLLEYFTIPEPTDERLKRARRRLATLMY